MKPNSEECLSKLVPSIGLAALLVCLVFVPCRSAAQGTVNFSNSGLDAPVLVNEELIGAGYFALLQLADGTNVGEPAPFLINGLFSGGIRTIEGFPPGAEIGLQVAVYEEVLGRIIGTSNAFFVALGGGDESGPATLVGLTFWPIHVFQPGQVRYKWILDLGVMFCFDNSRPSFHTGGDANLVDPCFCRNEPLPANLPEGEFEIPECRYDFDDSGLDYWVTKNGWLVFRWLPDSGSLYQSPTLLRSDARKVTNLGSDNGILSARSRISGNMKFFWLE